MTGSTSVSDTSPAKVEATDERTGELEAPVLPLSQDSASSSAAPPRPSEEGDEVCVCVCLWGGEVEYSSLPESDKVQD